MRGVLKGVGVLTGLVLLVGSLVLTSSRLLEPRSARWVQIEAFTPYAIGSYSVLLLVGLIGAIRSRHRGLRATAAALVLVSMAGLGGHTAWFLPQVSGTTPPAADGAPLLTVMTANQLGGAGDAVALLQEATDAGVDVLVVTEITHETLRVLRENGVEQEFPHRAGEPIDGVYGTMVFSRHRMDEEVGLPTEMASFDVRLHVAGRRLDLVAVHPTPPVDIEQWREEHRSLGDWVDATSPDLVVGDFNATADHEPMRTLADAGYRSVTDLVNEGWRPTWPANHRLFGAIPVPPLVQIDHILCGPHMTALRSRTVAIDGTDHLAVVAVVAPR